MIDSVHIIKAVMVNCDEDEKKLASASKKLPLLAYNLKLLEIIRLVFFEINYFLPIVLRFCGWYTTNKAVVVSSDDDEKKSASASKKLPLPKVVWKY